MTISCITTYDLSIGGDSIRPATLMQIPYDFFDALGFNSACSITLLQENNRLVIISTKPTKER